METEIDEDTTDIKTYNETDENTENPSHISALSRSIATTDSASLFISKHDFENTSVSTIKEEDLQAEKRNVTQTMSVTQNQILGNQKVYKRDAYYIPHQRFSVTYWMFYPFNYGKDMCTAKLGFLGRILRPYVGGQCPGDIIPIGNHVGDWEHITINFEVKKKAKYKEFLNQFPFFKNIYKTMQLYSSYLWQ